MTAQERWLAALWPNIRSHLPPPPAAVIELGCGRLGGFIPRLRAEGYDAVGVDPQAPEGHSYLHAEFEHCDLPRPAAAVIACASLHHVADPGEVLDRMVSVLTPRGEVVVVEWDWERFDEATALWSFERLPGSGPEGWLHRHREGWTTSGKNWEDYLGDWAAHHGLHGADRLISGLDQRFERLACVRGAFLFPELVDTDEGAELAAIDTGAIQALRVDYAARLA